MEERFYDIPDAEKQILNSLAEDIISLKTPTFWKLVEEGGLGTEEAQPVSG